MTTAAPGAIAPARSTVRWRAWTLVAICAAAGALYAWKIGSGEMGNSYYSAAVRSMTRSFTNFLFGSFDAYGVVTVDKPPLSLWPQAISVWIFGYHGWALLLPQVIEGVAAVFLLHRTVRMWAGDGVALLAAAMLALTPVTVAIDRYNNPDTLLVLLLVAAAYALTRSLREPSGRTSWLLWCAFFVGCGFLTKMLQAWIVVPGFALAYFAGTAAPVRRRLLDLLGAAAVLVASSFWWVALHDWWPGAKPYVGGSADGTAWNLIFDYNGFGRVFGREPGAGAGGAMAQGPPVPGGVPMMSGQTGLTKMFSEEVAGQIAWLLPLALCVLAVVSVSGVRRIVGKSPGDPARRGGWLLWGSWLLVTALVFSYAQGIWHAYYTTMLAPAVAAIAAAGLATLWRHYRDPEATVAWVLLPGVLTVTAAWAFVVVSRDITWHGWVRWAVLVVAAAAVAGLIVGRFGPLSGRRTARAALVTGIVSALLTPGVWSVAAATGSGNGMPAAGPGGGVPRITRLPNGGVIVTGGAPKDSGSMRERQRRILDYAIRNGGGAAIALAVTGANAAADYIMNSEAVVLAMGGFMGSDNVPTVDQLQKWVNAGTLRFVVGNPAGKPPGATVLAGSGGVAQERRQEWVERHCSVVDPGLYGEVPGSDSGPSVGPGLYGGGVSSVPASPLEGGSLYRCLPG